MVSLLFSLIIAGLIFYVLYWLIGQLALPAPFNKVAIVVISLCAAIYLIDLLMGLGGHSSLFAMPNLR